MYITAIFENNDFFTFTCDRVKQKMVLVKNYETKILKQTIIYIYIKTTFLAC